VNLGVDFSLNMGYIKRMERARTAGIHRVFVTDRSEGQTLYLLNESSKLSPFLKMILDFKVKHEYNDLSRERYIRWSISKGDNIVFELYTFSR
jgi:hypothetical protein